MDSDIITFSSDNSDKKGVVSEHLAQEDRSPDIVSLRPTRFDDYIGQKDAVDTLKIAIQAAKLRNEPLDHILLHGPPGLGKTTVSHIIANEMGRELTVTSGPTLEKGGDLVGILTHLGEGDILFVDEIHRIPKVVEEFLYPAMEDFAVDFVFDKGIHARSHRFRLKQFVLIGATTRVGLLSAPLRDRFGIFRTLDFYSDEQLMVIIKRSAAILSTRISDEGAMALARRSRGTPRVANRLLKRVRDYAQVKYDGQVSISCVEEALVLEGIDNLGLTRLDRSYLKTIISFYNGGPVGIEAIAATLQEETDTLVDVVEPYLLKIGLVLRTSSGRRASEAACRHLKLDLKSK
ncbi:MAG TPA: Holliday junction branch migration DNA helicase RuvB [Desulfobacteraceae bacterium]|nr:Holliday junction branch migration DNA helicase RuvB [Desulfobacteraceae bacterium]|tara:strand:+ start:524 stop:1567 length:1044 start_codon:yes stop_codon:yes gene_type:complete